MSYPLLKAIHVIFMVTWFAGLFYLPRLFIYHVEADDPAGRQRFCVMERKLFIIMTIGAVATAAFGIWMLTVNAGLLRTGWIHAKLTAVAALIGYHVWCWRLIRRFAADENPHSSRWLRWFNEAPALALVTIVVLAYLKPF
jgi:putative membrane protein